MKFRINYKSKKTIIAVIALIALFAVAFAGGYAWVKSNDQSTAVTDETVNDGTQNGSEDGNNQVSLPDLGDDEENNSSENNNGEDNSSETTNNNATNSNNSSTGTTATEDATTVIEQVVVGEKLVAEDTKMKWYPEEVEVPETSLDLLKSKLTVVKKAETLTGSNLVQAGETVNYTIEVTNNGAEALNKIEVSDIIPAGTTFKSVEDDTAILVKKTTETGEEVVTKIIWTIDVDAGKTVAVKFAVTVNEDATGTITNVAIANGDKSQEQQLAVIKADKTAVINNNPNLTEAKMGDEITYTISIENTSEHVTGTVLVKDSDLADILREELDVENIIEKAELVGAIEVNGVETEYTAEDLIAGINVPVEEDETATVVFTVKIKVIEGEISNAALIGNGKPTEPEKTNTVNITVTKKNDKNNAVVKVGDEINYTIELSNSGNIAGTTTVTDTLPEGVTFVEASEGGVYSNGKVTWEDVEVAPGTNTVTLTVKVTVNESVTGRITNKVEVEGKETTDGGLDTTNITFVKKNNDADKVVKVGDEIEYEIILSNSGSVTGTTDVIDTLPEKVTFKSATDDGEHSNGVVTWEDVEVLVGTSTKTVKVVVTVDSDATGKIENTATVEGKSDTDEGVNTTNITAVKENKDTDGVVKVGDTLSYTITLTNSGNVAGTTTVTDTLPVELEFVSASVRPTSTEAQADGTTLIIWEDVEVAGNNGTKTITVNTEVKTVSNQKIVNSVTVEGNTTPDQGVDTINITIEKDNNDPDGKVKVGDPLQYTITLTNSGNITGTTTVTDTLPAELEFVSSDRKTTSVVEQNDGTTLITWENVSVTGNNGTTTITVNTRVKSVSNKKIVNTATAEGKTDTDDGVDTVNITAIKENKDADGKVKVGDTLQYEITLTNSGTVTGTTKVVDILPAGLKFVSATVTPTSTAEQEDGTTKLTWEDVEVLTTETTTITVNTTVEAVSDEKMLNHVTVEGTTTTDSGVDTVNITAVKKHNDTDAVVKVGDEINYTIELSNSGSVAGTTTVTDTLPAGVTFVEASEGGVYSNGKVIWEYVEVTPGTNTVTLTVKVTVNESVTGRITNKVEVEGKETTDGGLDTVNITATKVNNDDDGKVEIGDSLSYTITLNNSGSVTGTTTVVDVLPKELEYNAEGTSPTPDSVTISADGATILTWNSISVSTEETTVITVNTTVESASVNKVINTVSVEGNDYNDDGVEVIGVIATKSVNKTHAEYGDILTYTITATSQSAVEQDLIIKDTIDTTKVEFISGSIMVNEVVQPDSLYADGTITYKSTIAGIGTKVKLVFQVKVISINVGDIITNKAEVNETDTDTVTTKVTKEVTVKYDAITEHPLDVILVLDTSGSMANSSRMTNLKSAAKSIVNILFPAAQDTGSTISLIKFSDSASLIGTYTGSQKATLIGTSTTTGEIDKLSSNGGTNEYAALEETLALLEGDTLQNSKKLVIFLSDGAATTGSTYNSTYAGGLINENNSQGFDNNTRANIEALAEDIKEISGVTVYSVGLGIDTLATNDIAWAEYCNDVDTTAVNPITVTGTQTTSDNNVTFTVIVSNSSDQDIIVPTITATLRGVNRDSVVANNNGSVQGWDNIRVNWEDVTVPANGSIQLTATATKSDSMGGGYNPEVSITTSHDYDVAGVCTNTEHTGISFTGTKTKDGKVYHYMNTKAWGNYTLEKIATSLATYEKVEDSSDVTTLTNTFANIIRKEISGTKTAYADSLPVEIEIPETHTIIGNITVTIGDSSNTYTQAQLQAGVNGLVYTPGTGFVWTITDETMLYKELSLSYAY